VTVDFQPPKLVLREDAEKRVLRPVARDLVTPEGKLRWSVQLGHGPREAFDPTKPLELSAVEAAGGATVFVEDEAGHVAEASYRVPATSDHPDTPEPTGVSRTFGCSAAGGLELLALVAWPGVRRRR
jgi:hypothetical protein